MRLARRSFAESRTNGSTLTNFPSTHLQTRTTYPPVILLSSTVLTTEMCIGKYLGQDFRTLNILIKILLSLDKATVVKGIIFHLYILSTVKCAIIISAVKQVEKERKMDLRSKRL